MSYPPPPPSDPQGPDFNKPGGDQPPGSGGYDSGGYDSGQYGGGNDGGGGYGPPPGGGYSGQPAGAPSGFDLGTAFSWSWKKFTENAVALILAVLIVSVLSGVLYFLGFLVTGALFSTGGTSCTYEELQRGCEPSAGPGFFIGLIAFALSALVAVFVAVVLGANIVKMLLGIADGRKAQLGDLFDFSDIGPVVILSVLVTLGTIIGSILCYIPGLIWGFLTQYALFFLKDKRQSPVDSIKSSISLVMSNLGTYVIVYLVVLAITFVGSLVCGIGLLVAAPVAGLLIVNAYRTTTGGVVAP